MPSEYKYVLLAKVSTDGDISVSKYKSVNSGLTICFAEVNGPLVSGHFSVVTEPLDDDGLPHTLEHLVFLGSEKYPYKGVLDLIANRCLARGTNAYTSIDHTCYTVTTAGSEGFLNILPIYLDHLLFPTLTDAAFITEIHHINGEGEDGGVVYAEMQGRENSGESRCYRGLVRALFPGTCGYKSAQGGALKNLRESTTNEKVKEFHKKLYRPDNMCFIIAGTVNPEDVFRALIPVEEKISKMSIQNDFVRPWQSPILPLTESVSVEIEYPADEEKYGLLLLAWRGPLINDFIQLLSVKVVLDYLTSTSVAPFNREFVEIENPLCNEIDFSIIGSLETCVCLYFAGTVVERKLELKEKVFKLIEKIATGEEKIDMQHLATLMKKKKLCILTSIENAPSSLIARELIYDFIYSTNEEHLVKRLQKIPLLESLFKKDENYWVNILKTYFVNKHNVTILGTPSIALSKKMQEDEKQRIKEQQEKLGPDGLAEKAKILKNATVTNEVPVPKEILSSIPVPSVQSICKHFHPIKRTCNIRELEGDQIDYSLSKMPCRFQIDVVKTNFVRVYVLIDTSHLSLESRLYLPLLIELLDECAINRDGKIIPYEEVVKQLTEDTIVVGAAIGFNYERFFCGSFAQMILLQLMVEEEKYDTSVQWIREILYQICIEVSRVKSTVNKMITDIPSIKRNGFSVAKSLMKSLLYKPESNHWSSSVFRQYKFLTELIKQLETNPEDVINKLNEIRDSITAADKMAVHLAVNLDSIKKKTNPEDAWMQKFLPAAISPTIMSYNFKKCSEYLQPISGDGVNNVIFGMGSLETSFLQLVTAGPTSRTDPNFPPLMLLNSYLGMFEGPMWKQIRGNGLSYDYFLSCNTDTGLLQFSLFKATHLAKGYKGALDVIESHLNGTTEWDLTLLESARAFLVSEWITGVKSVSSVINQSLVAYCRGTKKEFTKELQEMLEKVSKVTISDLEYVGNLYMMQLFNTSMSRCAITCNPTKVEEIVEEFKKFSRDLTVVPSLDDSFVSEYIDLI